MDGGGVGFGDDVLASDDTAGLGHAFEGETLFDGAGDAVKGGQVVGFCGAGDEVGSVGFGAGFGQACFDHGVEGGIDLFEAIDVGVDDLARGDGAFADETGEGGGRGCGELVQGGGPLAGRVEARAEWRRVW